MRIKITGFLCEKRFCVYNTTALMIVFILCVIKSAYPQEYPVVNEVIDEPAKAPDTAILSGTVASNITLDFKEADIRNVLKIISYKSGVNIVFSPEVVGSVTMRLVDVNWQEALKTILSTYGYGYEQRENIIMVAPIDKLTSMKKQEYELAQIQPTVTEVFGLKFIDAGDAKAALEPQLSGRGKVTVLEMKGQEGWEFSGGELGKRKRAAEGKNTRSKVIIVSDVPPVLDKIRKVIEQIDVMPKQVVIETRIMEANRDKLKDIGFDWGLGSTGAESSTIYGVSASKHNNGNSATEIGGHSLVSEVTPSGFNPKAGTNLSGTEPYNTGLEVLFRKLTGTQFEAILHALEEDVHTNTLSAPRIMALSNQEANILIGTRYPILKTEVGGTDSTTTTITLDYYQDIGIQLNVVPQVGADNFINMVIHPAVSSYTNTLGTNAYPIILTREAETRVVMQDGETIVIGGLLKDVKTKNNTGIPFLKHLPLLGPLFQRETVDTEKIDLLIFITAHIVRDDEFNDAQISTLEKRLNTVGSEKPEEK